MQQLILLFFFSLLNELQTKLIEHALLKIFPNTILSLNYNDLFNAFFHILPEKEAQISCKIDEINVRIITGPKTKWRMNNYNFINHFPLLGLKCNKDQDVNQDETKQNLGFN